jgi:hypothetical protein
MPAGENPQIDLAYRLLDLDLVDSEGRRCGKVDDIELDGGPGETTYVAALRSGPGALPPRFRDFAQPLAERVFRQGFERVPADRIDDFEAAVELTESARELGLGRGDRRLAEWFGKPPAEEPE